MTSLRHRFPLPWQGLYTALGGRDPLKSMELWLRKVQRCGHGARLSWDALVDCLVREEPVWDRKDEGQETSDNKLLFLPVFQHLPSTSQHFLLSFLFQHRDEISTATIQSLIGVISRVVSGQNEPPVNESVPSKTKNDTEATSDWLNYWVQKFCVHIEDRNIGENGKNTAEDEEFLAVADVKAMWKFSSACSEIKNKVMERLNRHGKEEKRQRNPWKGPLWNGGSCDRNDRKENLMDTDPVRAERSHIGSLDASIRLSAIQNQLDPDQTDPDAFVFTQYTEEPSRKIIRLDLTQSDEDDDFLSESKLGENLGEKLMGAASRMKDAWHRTPADAVSEDDLNALTQCTMDELSLLIDYLDLSGLPEANLVLVTEQIAGLKERLSLTHAGLIAKACLLKRLLCLDVAGSRALYQAFVALSQTYITEIIQSVFVPVMLDSKLGVHQSDLIVKVTKESFTADNRKKLLRCYLDDRPTLSSPTLPLIQMIVDSKTPLDGDTVGLLISTITRSAPSLQDNLKFGKVILGLAKGYDRQLSPTNINSLLQSVEGHKTFLKKSICATLKKIQSS